MDIAGLNQSLARRSAIVQRLSETVFRLAICSSGLRRPFSSGLRCPCPSGLGASPRHDRPAAASPGLAPKRLEKWSRKPIVNAWGSPFGLVLPPRIQLLAPAHPQSKSVRYLP